MVYEEQCVIQEYDEERSRIGKNPAVVWKRLQPQVSNDGVQGTGGLLLCHNISRTMVLSPESDNTL